MPLQLPAVNYAGFVALLPEFATNTATYPQSQFDAEKVFAACAANGVAVEVNSRPERLDPPNDLLKIAIDAGCVFSIDSDAHTPGQLSWQDYGCEHAAISGLEPERVINALGADDLLGWIRLRSKRA